MEQQTVFGRRVFALAAGLFCSLCLLYGPTLGHGFVNLDDDAYVVENAALAEGLTWDAVVWSFTAFHSANWHPLTWLSHALDVSLFGFHPGGHHLTNTVLHGLNVVLVFLLLLRLAGRAGPAFVVAALFAWHPLHVESVAWISERKDLLSVFFGLLCLAAYVRYAEKPGWGRYLPVFVLFAASLMAKPMLVTLPCVLLLLDLWPLDRLGRTPGRWALRVLEKLPLLALVAASAVLTLAAQQDAMAPLAARPLDMRVANAVVSVMVYLQQTFVPWPLAIPYPFDPERLTWWRVGGACALIAALTAWALWQWRRGRPYAIVGWLWFLGTLVPVIGIVQVGEQAHADRYTYFPHIGLFIALVWTGFEAVRRWPAVRRPLAGATMLFLAACLVLAHLQIGKWKDSETLFRHALAVTEANFVAHNNLGKALMEQGAYDEAREQFEASVTLSPTNIEAQNNLGVAYLAANELQAAVDTFALLVHHLPDDPEIRVNYGVALLAAGYPQRARREAEAALARAPGFPQALELIAWVDSVLESVESDRAQ